MTPVASSQGTASAQSQIESHPAGAEVRAWLADHPSPSARQLAEAGYVAPHWPAPWGLGADGAAQLAIDSELRRAGVKRPSNPIGIGWAGPTILHAGTEAQKQRYLMPMLSGEEIWCQLFSEPEAGSDLAGLSTRAVRDGDEYVVNGSKIWTTLAHEARFGILLARTDPDVPKHEGISYLICPMDAPGVTIKPIKDMTGLHAFNEVFLDGVRIPVGNRVGEENGVWPLAKVTLGNERVSLSGEGAIWGNGPTVADLLEKVRRSGGTSDPVMRQRLAGAYVEAEVLRLIRLRTVSAALQGRQPGPEASVRKAMADDHGQRLMGLAKDLEGMAGLLSTGAVPSGRPAGEPGTWGEEIWSFGFLFSPALTIGGGTAQVQRNIIAERVLGLPHDLDVESKLSWSESHRRGKPA
ncbi:MAG: acyl-CoA dehydrogenase family protein [Actinobacteria bacterium]|nr:acyl-CoA dehydrogenase family protein [Actinomycetota bacterium]